jgi:DNA-binding response OmpR family regulator
MEGFEPVVAGDGEEAIRLFTQFNPDVVLLDVMMPKEDGYEVCRKIRSKSNVPVILITARGEDFDKIMGLDIGADDYIVKPFSPREVMARVRAVMRRMAKTTKEATSENILKVGNL